MKLHQLTESDQQPGIPIDRLYYNTVKDDAPDVKVAHEKLPELLTVAAKTALLFLSNWSRYESHTEPKFSQSGFDWCVLCALPTDKHKKYQELRVAGPWAGVRALALVRWDSFDWTVITYTPHLTTYPHVEKDDVLSIFARVQRKATDHDFFYSSH